MTAFDCVIIGGGIAGTTSAETLRRADSTLRIALIEREPYPLYSRVLIPCYLKKTLPREKLFLRTIAQYQAAGISLYEEAVVVGLDPARHEIQVVFSGKNSESPEVFSYKKLLIASGGTPRPLPESINFGDGVACLRMQTLDDADAIAAAMERAATRDALVLGEGFIAFEFMETFAINGFHSHVLCRGGIFGERRFGVTGGRMLEAYYEKHGVRFYKNIKDEELAKKDQWLVDHKEHFTPSLVGVGIGITRTFDQFPSVEHQKGILADEYLQTSDPDIWAAGDIAEFYDTIAKRHRVMGNWASAFLQGHIAGLNMHAALQKETVEKKTALRAVPAYTIINFGLNITMVGDTEEYDEVLERAGNPVHPTLARLYFKEGKLCGATLINRFTDKTRLVNYIEQGVNRNEIEKAITD